MSQTWNRSWASPNAPTSAPAAAAPATTTPAPAPAPAPAPETQKLRAVQVDGLVLMKIVKHCTQSLPELCAGSLLGMDMDNTLEVTNCFPFPVNAEEDAEYDGSAYQSEMMKLLRDVNVDYNSVGWYRSTYMGSFCTADLVEHQFNHQDALDQGSNEAKSVVLIYDPFQTSKGNLSIKAYRLTQKFMNVYREHKANGSVSELNLNSDAILEEVPIEITNSEIINVFLNDIAEKETKLREVDFERLDLSTNPYLEKNLEFLVEEVDSLAQEQQKFQQYQIQVHYQKQKQAKFIAMRKAENVARKERGEPLLPEEDPSLSIFKPITCPSKLETLLIRNQIDVYCDQINRFAGTSFSKLFLVSGVEK